MTANERKPYFNPSYIPEPKKRFVAWVDLMGTKNRMSGSLKVISTSIFKLHVAALDAQKHLGLDNIKIFPVMDGFYAATEDIDSLTRFIKDVYTRSSSVFLEDACRHDFQYLLKGAISFGNVYYGGDLPDNAAKRLKECPAHRDAIIIGQPVVDAYQTESSAPPYGVAIHETAKSSFHCLENDKWWSWLNDDNKASELYEALRAYFEWCMKNDPKYPEDRIVMHNFSAKKYFLKKVTL